MCDYSLESYQSRPAAVGEKLTLGRFASGSMGFAGAAVPATAGGTIKSIITDCAVCIPAGSKLLLEGIDQAIQKDYGVGAVEEVAMTRLEGGLYKDAVRFSNGKEVLLQRLNVGLTAAIMTYGAETVESERGSAHVGDDASSIRQRTLIDA